LFQDFNNVSKARGVRCECILSGLLAVASHLAAHSTIQISGNYKLVPTMLWCISGLIGTNKSGLISLMRDSFMRMEVQYKQIDAAAVSGVNNSTNYGFFIKHIWF